MKKLSSLMPRDGHSLYSSNKWIINGRDETIIERTVLEAKNTTTMSPPFQLIAAWTPPTTASSGLSPLGLCNKYLFMEIHILCMECRVAARHVLLRISPIFAEHIQVKIQCFIGQFWGWITTSRPRQISAASAPPTTATSGLSLSPACDGSTDIC